MCLGLISTRNSDEDLDCVKRVLSYVATEANLTQALSCHQLGVLFSLSFLPLNFLFQCWGANPWWCMLYRHICIWSLHHVPSSLFYLNLLLLGDWERIFLHSPVCPHIVCVAMTTLPNTWITSMGHHTLPNHFIFFYLLCFSIKLSKSPPTPFLLLYVWLSVCICHNIEEEEECFATSFCLCLYFLVSIFICFCLSVITCLCSAFQCNFCLLHSFPFVSQYLFEIVILLLFFFQWESKTGKLLLYQGLLLKRQCLGILTLSPRKFHYMT